MSWNKNRSLERIKSRWKARDCEITVSRLTKLMDLENLTLRNSRLITGAHLYVSVARSEGLADLETEADARAAVRRLALWQDEYSKIAAAFEIPVVAFQGARAHSLVYRPISDAPAIAERSVLFLRAVALMTNKAFNANVEAGDHLSAHAGIDIGDTVGTRGGTKGDSELLFLGNAANRGAKLVGGARILADERVIDVLPETLPVGLGDSRTEGARVVTLAEDAVLEGIERLKVDWTVEASFERIATNLERWPLNRFQLSGATQLIDLDGLGRANSKFVNAAVIIADIDGFSDYIAGFEDDAEKREAILVLDMIRHELREVLRTDFSGVRIQYQGDNIIGVVHLPNDDATAMAKQAVDIAAGMQASMSHTLPEVVDAAQDLDVTVGIATSNTIISRLGGYGRRNALVVGRSATNADDISRRLDAREIGIDSTTYGSLDEVTQALFSWSATAKAYVASELSSDKVTLAREASNGGAGTRRLVSGTSGATAIVPAVGKALPGERDVRPFRPFAE